MLDRALQNAPDFPAARSEAVVVTGGSLLSAVQARDSESIGRPGGFGEAGILHPYQHLVWGWEALHGCRKIGVGATNARNESTYTRQHLLKVDAIEGAHRSLGLAEVEDSTLATRLQYANNLAE